jgi:NAD+ kinase
MPPSLHFVAAAAPDAQAALALMRQRHKDVGAEKSEIVVALGGDGFMLQTLHSFIGKGKPIYGMNLGSVGFLMNEFRENDLIERLAAAEPAQVHPLRMRAQSTKGVTEALAFNDVHLFRETR